MVDSPFLDLLLFAVLSAARQEVLAANSTEYLLRKAPWFSVCEIQDFGLRRVADDGDLANGWVRRREGNAGITSCSRSSPAPSGLAA